MANKEVIYCADVAKRLDIQPHKCSRRSFIGNKSHRHRLRSFSLDDEKDKEYLRRVFSLHPQVARSTRKPIDERIKSAMGGVTFEMCDNLRNRIEKQLKLKNKSSSTSTSTTIISDNNDDTTTTSTTTNNNSSTINNVTISNEDFDDSCTIQTEVTSPTESIIEGQEQGTIDISNEPIFQQTKRRPRNSVLIDLINSETLLQFCNNHRKKPSELKCYKSIQKRADESLAHLIRLCGCRGTIVSLEKMKIYLLRL